MTEKELREIKRRFRHDKNNIPRIVGCFVNGNKQIISRISQSLTLSDELLNEKLLSVMKKTLSGSLGTNLTDIAFSTKEVLESDTHKLLSELWKSRLENAEALEKFYTRVTESVNFEGNYVILLANDIYDVFAFGKDGEAAESTTQFSYIICAVCPVKNMNEALSFRESDSLFHIFSPTSILSAPELGFMFPTFDNRQTNIYNALYYTRSLSNNYPDFTEQIFGKESAMPPVAQKAAFSECIAEALSEECSFEVIRSLHAEVGEMLAEKKETKSEEPLVITKATVKSILEGCGIDDEKIAAVGSAIDESFGANAELVPKNIVSPNKFEIETPYVKIKVDPEHRDVISTQIINDVKYVMIRADGGVCVNGINIKIED